jgi:hypothetical protein
VAKVTFARWLRATSEHYLMVAAQQKMAAKYQVAPPPPRPRGTEWFWLRVYVPAYQAVPWPVRSAIMRRMPGSHRMTWTKTQHSRGPGS